MCVCVRARARERVSMRMRVYERLFAKLHHQSNLAGATGDITRAPQRTAAEDAPGTSESESDDRSAAVIVARWPQKSLRHHGHPQREAVFSCAACSLCSEFAGIIPKLRATGSSLSLFRARTHTQTFFCGPRSNLTRRPTSSCDCTHKLMIIS